jgi:hypothetical protein
MKQWLWFMTPSSVVRAVGTDVLERHYSSHVRLQVSLFLRYFNNRLPDYAVSQPTRLQHKSFHQAPRLSTVSITPPICHTHARSPASAAPDALLGCCEATDIRDNITVPSSRVNQSNSFWTAWPPEDGEWCCQDTSVSNYWPTPHNKSEEQTLLPYWFFIHYHRSNIISATDSVVK